MKKTIKMICTREYEIELYEVASTYVVARSDGGNANYKLYSDLSEALGNFDCINAELEEKYDKDTGDISF